MQSFNPRLGKKSSRAMGIQLGWLDFACPIESAQGSSALSKVCSESMPFPGKTGGRVVAQQYLPLLYF